MDDWNEIRAWRRATQADLLSRRLAVPRAERLCVRSVVRDSIFAQFPELRHACIGLYWPFKGEIDLLDRARAWVVRKLHEALHRIGDSALHRDLTDMLMVHESNIRRCAALR